MQPWMIGATQTVLHPIIIVPRVTAGALAKKRDHYARPLGLGLVNMPWIPGVRPIVL